MEEVLFRSVFVFLYDVIVYVSDIRQPEHALLCWPVTTIGLYDCLNVPFFVRCASLGPDNRFI